MTLVVQKPAPKKTRISARANELATLLDEYPGIKVLSLDCFDTLLWRSTATPIDVFYDLAHSPTFMKLGLNAKMRVRAESKARSLSFGRTGKHEVVLAQIYRAAFPDLDDATVETLSNEEIEAEIKVCEPLVETCDLIRAARAKKIKVVITSDTYLTEAQLRRLLAAKLPEDVYRALDRVFVSSFYGRAKGNGMFEPVLRALGHKGRDVLHVGDNPHADLGGARAAGIHGVQLAHHESDVDAVLRLQSTMGSLLFPTVREEESMPSPFRRQLAAKGQSPDATFLLGYAALGPVLFSFGKWLLAELDAMRAEGKRPKPVFLMRDGYMPEKIARILNDGEVGPLLSISRFAAMAASFRSPDDIERYLAEWAGSKRYADLARQMLLSESESAHLVSKDKKPEAFLQDVMKSKLVPIIIERSAAYRARLFAHLEKNGIEPGDTAVFVDLGYEGTAQRHLMPVLADEKNVEIQGRYLIAARVPAWEKSRKGLLDPSWCDDRAISTIVTYIALLENLCAADTGSTVDYTETGEPIRSASIVDPRQTARVEPVQHAAEAFARDCKDIPYTTDLRRYAAAALARMLLAPTKQEVEYISSFKLDLNLGADDNVALFDVEKGLAGLRRQGIFSLASQSDKLTRIAAPVELRAASLETALTSIAQHRYGLELALVDMSLRRESLGILVLRGAGATRVEIEAQATHDGWFAVHLPVSEGEAIGIQLGESYAFVQIDSVACIPRSALHTPGEEAATEDAGAWVHGDGLSPKGDGLFECEKKESLLLVAPPRGKTGILRLVFRPITRRHPN